jgi:hypothetical protein
MNAGQLSTIVPTKSHCCRSLLNWDSAAATSALLPIVETIPDDVSNDGDEMRNLWWTP